MEKISSILEVQKSASAFAADVGSRPTKAKSLSSVYRSFPACARHDVLARDLRLTQELTPIPTQVWFPDTIVPVPDGPHSNDNVTTGEPINARLSMTFNFQFVSPHGAVSDSTNGAMEFQCTKPNAQHDNASAARISKSPT